MLDIKSAYEILGIKEGADKDEIFKRYNTLLKKHRMAQQNSTEKDEDMPGLDEINAAYNALMGYQENEDEQPENKRPGIAKPILNSLNVDEKKVSNFFYYHKVHIIVTILVIITFAVTLKSCMNRVTPDLNVAYLGNFAVADPDMVNRSIKDNIPDIKAPNLDGAGLTDKIQSDQDVAMQQKAMILIAVADVDVFILDKNSFDVFSKQGAFASLDDYVDVLGIDKEKNKDYIVKTDIDTDAHLYGVNVISSDIFKGTGLEKKDKILAICPRIKNKDNALKFVKMLLK